MDPLDSHGTRRTNHHLHQSVPYSVPSYPSTSTTDREEFVRSTIWHSSHPHATNDSSVNHPIAVQSASLPHSNQQSFSSLSVGPTGHPSRFAKSISYASSINEFNSSRTYAYSIPFTGHPGQQIFDSGYHDSENELNQSDVSEKRFSPQTAPVQDTRALAKPLRVFQISSPEQADPGSETHYPPEPRPQMPLYPESCTDSSDNTHHRHQHSEAYVPFHTQSYTYPSMGYHNKHVAFQADPLTHMMTEGYPDHQHIRYLDTTSLLPFPAAIRHSPYTHIPASHTTEYSLMPHPQAHPASSSPISYLSHQSADMSVTCPSTTKSEGELLLGSSSEVLEQGKRFGEGWELNPSIQSSAFPSDIDIPIFHTGSTFSNFHQNSSSDSRFSPRLQFHHPHTQSSLHQQQQSHRRTAKPVLHKTLPSPSTSSSSRPSQSFISPEQDHMVHNADSAYSSVEPRSRSISHSTTSSSPVPQNIPLSTLHPPNSALISQSAPYIADSEPSSAQSLTFTDRLINPPRPTMLTPDGVKGNFNQSTTSKKKKRTIHPNPPLASCSLCQKPLMRLLMRGTMEDWKIDWVDWWVCMECSESRSDVPSQTEVRSGIIRSGVVAIDSTGPMFGLQKGKRRDRPIGSTLGQSTSGSLTTGPGAGGVGRRKRTRETMNTEAPLVCDVCFKYKGQGGIVPRDGKSELKFSVEFVCMSCEEKYRRCTDCGSGGGARIGIGKWRSKELFINNRKTCLLSHVRIGSAPTKLGTWDVKDIEDEDVWNDLLDLCEALWKDRLLSRMAIPDVLEANLGDLNDRPRTFADVQATLDAGWPGRKPLNDARQEVMSPQSSCELPHVADDNDHGSKQSNGQKFRKYLGLTWCKCKPRRSGPVSTFTDGGSVDIGAVQSLGSGIVNLKDLEKGRQLGEGLGEGPVGDENTDSTIPLGYELTGLYIGDWNMNDGTLLITTSLPFEGSDSEDRSALTVGEMIIRIVAEIEEANTALSLINQNQGEGQEKRKVPSLEHLWCISDGMTSQIRDKMHESLMRKRQFLPLDEYLTQYPSVRPEIFHKFPYSLPGPWVDGVGIPGTIMVRWLGQQFDRKQLEEVVAKNEIWKRSIKAKSTKG